MPDTPDLPTRAAEAAAELRRVDSTLTAAPWECESGSLTNWHDSPFEMEWIPNGTGDVNENRVADGKGIAALRNLAAPLADLIDAQAREIERLELELIGENKANALLNAGMGSVCEGRDALKHENRALRARIADSGGELIATRIRAEGAAQDLLEALEGLVAFLNANMHQEPWAINPHLLKADVAIRKAKV